MRVMLTSEKRIRSEVGNYVYLEVSPKRSVWRFNMKRKVSTKVCRAFQDVRNMVQSGLRNRAT